MVVVCGSVSWLIVLLLICFFSVLSLTHSFGFYNWKWVYDSELCVRTYIDPHFCGCMVSTKWWNCTGFDWKKKCIIVHLSVYYDWNGKANDKNASSVLCCYSCCFLLHLICISKYCVLYMCVHVPFYLTMCLVYRSVGIWTRVCVCLCVEPKFFLSKK